MVKLFSLEGLEDNNDVISKIEDTKEEKLEEIKEEEQLIDNDVKISIENIEVFSRNADLALYLKDNEDVKVSIENYYPVIKTISSNLNIKKIPSIEDFKDTRKLNTSLHVALEGRFIDFLKKIWEKVKDFIITLYKKIKNFFKKLLGFNLDLEVYDKELERLMTKIKDKSYTLKNNTPIETKLCSILADKNASVYGVNDLLFDGTKRIKNFQYLLNDDTRDTNIINIIKFLVNNKIKLNKLIIDTEDVRKSEEFRKAFDILAISLSKAIMAVNELSENSDEETSNTSKYYKDISNFYAIFNEIARSNLFSNFTDFIIKLKEDIVTDRNLDLSINAIEEAIKNNFLFKEIAPNSLPDEVYEKFYSYLDSSLADAKVYRVENNYKLPFNFNIYGLFKKEYESITELLLNANIDTSVELLTKIVFLLDTEKQYNSTVNNTILPISDKNNLFNLYDQYKELSKIKINKIIDDVEENILEVEKSIKDLERHNLSILDKYNSLLMETAGYFKNFINYMRQFNNQMNDFIENNTSANSEIIIAIKNRLNELNETMNVLEERIGNNGNEPDTIIPSLLMGFNAYLTTFIKAILVFYQNYANNFRLLANTSLTCYTELRFELAKYLYECARKYSKV